MMVAWEETQLDEPVVGTETARTLQFRMLLSLNWAEVAASREQVERLEHIALVTVLYLAAL